MKKHIFGFALFSFIVGTAIFIYSMLNPFKVENNSAPNYSPSDLRVNSCWRMKRNLNTKRSGSPIIKQAIFNLQSKQLNWELDTSTINTPIALNFFIKDDKGTRYINTKIVPINAYHNGRTGAASSFLWLNNLDSYENLYVTAEPVTNNYEDVSKDFDLSKAAPVLIY